MTFIDPVLDHVEKRVTDIMWTFKEFDTMNVRQLAAVRELVQTVLTDTRKHFENAVIGVEK